MRGGKWSHTEDTEYTEPCGAGFFSRRRLRRLSQNLVKHNVNKREIHRGARYACATIRMASTNKVCALLRKSAQSA